MKMSKKNANRKSSENKFEVDDSPRFFFESFQSSQPEISLKSFPSIFLRYFLFICLMEDFPGFKAYWIFLLFNKSYRRSDEYAIGLHKSHLKRIAAFVNFASSFDSI